MLLDSTKLAREIGVSTWLPKAVKVAAAELGDSPFVGRYTTKEKFLSWLDRHPDFVASHWLRKKRPN